MYTRPWADSESEPEDSDLISAGAEEIRNTKVDIREREEVDRYWGVGEDDGEYKKVTLHDQTENPLSQDNKGIVFTKEESGLSELHYRDSDGNITLITKDGELYYPSKEYAYYAIGSDETQRDVTWDDWAEIPGLDVVISVKAGDIVIAQLVASCDLSVVAAGAVRIYQKSGSGSYILQPSAVVTSTYARTLSLFMVLEATAKEDVTFACQGKVSTGTMSVDYRAMIVNILGKKV